MARRRIPDERLERAVRVRYPDGSDAGVGSHEIDALWAPSVDPEVLNDRLRRRKLQVEKLKRDRSELKAALRLRTEEAYVEGQLSVAPLVVDLKKKLVQIAADIVEQDEITDDNIKLLKVALQQVDRWEDRTYGKSRQRQQVTSFSASADVTELLSRGREVPRLEDVTDVEAIEEGGAE